MKLFNLFGTQPVDIECATANKVFEVFNRLRRTDDATRASAHSIPSFTCCHTTAFRTDCWKLERNRFFRALAQINIRNFWDHITCTVDLDPIAQTHIAPATNIFALGPVACNIVLIVQCRVGNNDTTHSYRLQPRHGA